MEPIAANTALLQRHPFLITFSGIDGAGKTTQIDAVSAALMAADIKVFQLAFWDDAVFLRQFRESAGYKVFKGDPGVGSPSNPVNRRDKNVQGWYLTLSRLCLYFLDALRLRFVIARQKGKAEALIFDRYIFDELANLPLNSGLIRAYVRLVLKIVPQPDLAYLLDANPEEARSRKPEYPLEFLIRNRDSYLALSRLAGNIKVIEALSASDVTGRVLDTLKRKLSSSAPSAPHPALRLKNSMCEQSLPLETLGGSPISSERTFT